jgi:hypothetical protein
LRREDGTVVEEGDLPNYVCSFFQDLFTSSAGDRTPELIEKVVPRVTSAMNDCLLGEFKEEEIKSGIDQIGES